MRHHSDYIGGIGRLRVCALGPPDRMQLRVEDAGNPSGTVLILDTPHLTTDKETTAPPPADCSEREVVVAIGPPSIGCARSHGPLRAQSLVLQQKLTKRLDYVLQSDIGNQNFGSPFTGLAAEWYGINQYLFYELNCCWTLGIRGEWFRDDDGLRVGGIGRRDTGSPIVPFGFAGDFYNLSVGANYKPNANLTVRPELRFDWYDGFSGFGPRPYDDGADDEQITGAVDFIVAF